MGNWKLCKGPITKNSNLDIDIYEVLNSNNSEIILCIGQVQSGKTNRILSIIERSVNLNYDLVIIFGGTTNSLLNQTLDRINNKFYDNEKTIIKNINNFTGIINSKVVILNILKNSQNIKKLYNVIENENWTNRRALLIDDECDYGSINSMKDQSALYSEIYKLYDRFHNCKMFQVTATPYANILSERSSKLRASKVICWGKNEGYTGWDFFNEKKDQIYQIVNYEKGDSTLLEGLILKAIQQHFYSSYLLYKFNKEEGSDLLINVSLEKGIHNNIKEECEHLINYKLIQDNRSKFFYSGILEEKMSWDEFEYFLKYYLKNIQIKVLNSDEQIEGNKSKYEIIIGGALISRGNTYKNLLVELILNSPNEKNNVDTLLQRCRWFGYRENHRVQCMKIIMSESIFNSLNECKEYVHLFEEGIYNIAILEEKLQEIDKDKCFVRGTCYGKSK